MSKTNKDEVMEPAIEAEVKEVAIEATEKDPKADWPELYIPKRDKEDKQRLFSVNLKKYMVLTGVHVKVPPEVYEVYQNSLKAEEERDRYDEENQ